MSTPASKPSEAQRSLLRFLQREGKIAAADVVRVEKEAHEKGVPIAEALELAGIISERDLAALMAATLRLRQIDLTAYPFDPGLARELKEAVATRYEIVPLRVDGRTIEVATANPLDLDGLKAVEFATGKRVKAVVASRSEIRDGLAHVYRLQESLDQFLQHVPDESVTVTELHDPGDDLRKVAQEAELPPVVKLADLILIEGIKSRASDVHVEPATDAVAVRYRIDGILEESFRFPKWVQNALVARLKVMAQLDITERRLPQDGRIQLRYQDRVVDLRVSSLPAQHGEKITLRILDAATGIKALDRLGFGNSDLQKMREAIAKPEGLILVTGPTGSGKTTTLYALLREKISPNLNIVTIENPIEYQLKGINQVEVNDKQGLTFAGVLRSVLRQDPDVILIGEIRDEETAQIAMQAAQTGHLVLSTVHTNDASAAVTRLIDLGIDSSVVASTMHLVVAQRLVRRSCPACSEPYVTADDTRRLLRLDEAAAAQIRHGKGCMTCRQTGYSGRVGVYEVVPITPALTKLIESNAGESLIRQQARKEGHNGVIDDAREKLLAGVTTPEEVLRVVQVNDYAPRCPGCEREVVDEYSVCPHCGTELRATCSGCGKPLTAGWTSCPYCGIKAGAAKGAAADVDAPGRPPARQRSYKALVVDDSEAIRDIVRITLERADLGLSVVTACDGKEALERIAVERPDVVLLDLQMPEIDGFEVCRRLRSDVRTAFLPILILTAQQGEEHVTKAFAVGTDDYVVKPFRRDELVMRVRRVLERTYGKGDQPLSTNLGARTMAFAATASRADAAEGAGNGGAAATPSPVAPLAGAEHPSESPERAPNGRVTEPLAQLVADKAALSSSILRCEERLAALTSRLDAESTLRSEEVRTTLERIRITHELALTQLRGDQARTASEAMHHTDTALRAIQEESERVTRQSEESLAAARALIRDLKSDAEPVDQGTERTKTGKKRKDAPSPPS